MCEKSHLFKVMTTCREPAWESPPHDKACGRDLVGTASQNSRGAPLSLPERLPQKPEPVCFTASWLPPTPLTVMRGYPQPLLSIRKQFRALVYKSPGYNKVCSNCDPLRKPSNQPNRFPDYPTAMDVIVYGLPAIWGTRRLSYSNNAEPLGELEIIKIELIEEIFIE